MDRHRGDRYYGSNNGNNSFNDSNKQDSHYNRHNRPSRFSDGPLTNRYNHNNQESYQYNGRSSPSEFRVDVGGGGGGGHRPFDLPPRHAPGSGEGFRPLSGGGEGGGVGGFRPMGGGFGSGLNYPEQQPPPSPQLLGQKRGLLGRGGSSRG